VSDTTTISGEPGTIRNLSYSVLSTGLGADISLAEDGVFTFQFATTGLSGSITIEVTATDANGNVTAESITLIDGGAIPSFAAEPGTQSVTLTWDDVPLSSSYTIYYTDNGSFPSEQNGTILENVTSPHAITNLQNGARHVFRLKSTSSSGEDNLSGYVSAMPLSTLTLAPWVMEGPESLSVAWNEVSGEDTFTIWRRSQHESALSSYTLVTGNSFTDTNVSEGVVYYYAVSPELSDKIVSETDSGEIWPFSTAEAGYAGTLSIGGGGDSISDTILYGDYLYLAKPSGLAIVNINDPDYPVLENTLEPSSSPERFGPTAIDIVGSLAYVTEYSPYNYIPSDPRNYDSAFRIYDITDPVNPLELGSISWDGAVSPRYTYEAIEVSGTFAYTLVRESVSDEYSLKIFDVSNPDQPEELETGTGGELVLPDRGTDLVIVGDYAYVAVDDNADSDNDGGVYVVDISTADTPVLAAGATHYITDGNLNKPRAVALSGSNLCVNDFSGGLTILDISAPTYHTAPARLGSYDPGGQGNGVAIAGNIAYLAMGNADFWMVNITDPTDPTEIQEFILPGSAYHVSVGSDNTAYVIDVLYGLRIFTMNVPNAPILSGSTSTGFSGSSQSVVLEGAYGYVAAGSNGLFIYDVSNPSAPLQVGVFDGDVSLPDTVSVYAVSVHGDYALLADSKNDLIVLDVSSPASPEVVGFCDHGYSGRDIVVFGDYAYLVGVGSGLTTYNVGDPSNPEVVRRWDFEGGVGLARFGSGLTFHDRLPATMCHFDLTDREEPVWLGTATDGVDISHDSLSHADSYGDYVYITGEDYGIHVIDMSDPQSHRSGNRIRGDRQT